MSVMWDLRLPAITFALLMASLTGCSEDHTTDATNLRKDLSRMASVKSVDHQYESGGTILPGSLSMTVTMSPDATTDETLAVVERAYDEFATSFQGDSADLSVHRRGTQILVHTRHPQADIDDILEIARFSLETPRTGERIRADMVAARGEDYGELVSEVRLSLGRGSSKSDISPRLSTLALADDLPEGSDLWVLSMDGAGVGGSRGLPTEEDLAVWRALSSVATPGTITVEFGPFQLYSDLDQFGFANITVRATPKPTRRQLAAMKTAHLSALAERSEAYVYNVTVNGEDAIWLRGPRQR